MIRRAPVVAGLTILLLLAGCARRMPHGVAERYLENLQQFNYSSCYALLSDQDRKQRSFTEFLTEIPLAPDVSPVWFRPVLHHTHFQLGEVQRSVDGLTASVPVQISTPDLTRWERALNASVQGQVSESGALRSLDLGEYPVRTYSDVIFLVKEHHHWRVRAGFGERDMVIDQHRAALNDYLAQHYAKAIPEWRNMIGDLESQRATGSRGLADRYRRELARMQQLNDAQGADRAYATHLKLSNVAMKMSEERAPAIFGRVSNTGDHAVDALSLVVSWYEGRGTDLRAVAREEHPVVTTPVQFTDFTEQVRPFLPGESRAFGFLLSAPIAVQQQASPYVSIDSIALSETPQLTSKSGIGGAQALSATPGKSPGDSTKAVAH